MNKRYLTVSGLALAMAIAAGTAHAQDDPAKLQKVSADAPQTTPPGDAPAADDQQSAGPDIIVTATKRSESLSNVPMSITAVTGDSLKEKGITNVADLVKITPGLSFVESGLSVPVYSLRGVGFFDTSIGARPTVSVYVDEAPLPFSITTPGAAFDLERVEVLKGPQGTLFGQNSTGGTINYIAAKPKDVWEGGFTGSYARFNTFDTQGYITGPIAPNLTFRLAARSVNGDGWQKSQTRGDALGRQKFAQGRFILDWNPTSKLRIALNLNGFVDYGDTQAAQLIGILYVTPSKANEVPLLAAAPLAPANNRAADWDKNGDFRKHNRFYQATARIDYDLSDDITLTSLTSWSRMLTNMNNDVDATAVESSTSRVVGKVSSFSEELRLAGDMGPVRWIVGGNFSRDHSTENDYYHFPYASANHAFTPLYSYNETNPYTLQRFSTYAAFGNVDIKLGKITLHGGLRFTQADLDYSGCTKVNSDESGAAITTLFNVLRTARGLPALPFLKKGQCQSLDATLTPNLRTSSFNQNNLSWRGGIDYKPTDDVLLYANVSRGYKAGSVPNPGAINLEEFDPVNQESLLAYEVGFKAAFANKKVNLSGAAFYYDYTDKQLLARRITTPNILGALPALINVPKSWIKGAEAQLTVYPVTGLSFTAAATYLDSKVTSTFINYTILATQANFTGEAFPYTPKWQLVFDSQYKFPLSDKLNGMIGGNLNYRSSTSAGFGAATSAYLYVKPYALLDLRAGVEDPNGKWSAQIFGRNVTDTYYWTNVAKYNDVVRRFAGMPATYGVQFSYKF